MRRHANSCPWVVCQEQWSNIASTRCTKAPCQVVPRGCVLVERRPSVTSIRCTEAPCKTVRLPEGCRTNMNTTRCTRRHAKLYLWVVCQKGAGPAKQNGRRLLPCHQHRHQLITQGAVTHAFKQKAARREGGGYVYTLGMWDQTRLGKVILPCHQHRHQLVTKNMVTHAYKQKVACLWARGRHVCALSRWNQT